MAKLTAFAALFVALIAVASAYTTVVTTVINDEKSCQMEVQQMQMRDCMQWMQKGISPFETAPFLRSAVASTEEHQQECCREMRKVRPDCHCDMMRKMMMMMQPMMEMEKMRAMFSKCGMQIPMGCSFM